MTADSRIIKANGTNMAGAAVKPSLGSRTRLGRASAQVDAKHRRWINQVLAESQGQSVSLPWTRTSAGVSVNSARKTPQDVN